MNDTNVSGTSAMQPQREIVHIAATHQESPQKMRVAGYARVSSDSKDQLNSFATQVAHYSNLISKNDAWEFVDMYADEGISGISMSKRDEFNRMIDDCRNGLIDRIITKSMSRFSRNTTDTLSILRELRMLGIGVYFEKENIDTATTSSEEIITIYAMMAQHESESISQNCKRGARMRMKNGTYVAASAPYGYRLVDDCLRIEETEAQVVRRIFQSYINGTGQWRIAKMLQDEGVINKSGSSRWHPKSISVILRNERYIGDILLQKNYNEDTLPYKKRPNRGELPKYYTPNAHEAIISKEDYEYVQGLLKSRATLNFSQTEYVLFSGKIKCATCGSVHRRREIRGKFYWLCRKNDTSLSRCSSEVISEKALHRAFIRMYNKLQLHYDAILTPMITNFEHLQELQQKGNTELKTLNKEIARLAEQNHVLTELVSKGILDSALFLSQSDGLNRQLSKCKQRKSKILENTRQDDSVKKTNDLATILNRAEKQIFEMDECLFHELIETIVACNNQTIKFVLINGLELTERLCE